MAVQLNSNYYYEYGPIDGRMVCDKESYLWTPTKWTMQYGDGPFYKGLITVVVESGKEGIYMCIHDGSVDDDSVQLLTQENYLQYWKKLATSSVFEV